MTWCLFILPWKQKSLSKFFRESPSRVHSTRCTQRIQYSPYQTGLCVHTILRDVQMKEVMFLFAGATKYNTFARFVKWNHTKQILRNSQIQGRLKLWLHLFKIQIVHYRQPDKECLIFNHSQMIRCIHIWKQTVQRWKT